MRRFSQRHSLVTLSDINITPLLDLAFVLLIIFVITTPLLEQGMDLNLPQGGKADRRVSRQDVRTVEVSTIGVYVLGGQRLSLAQVVAELVRAHQANPNLVVYIRADKTTPYGRVFELMNALGNRGLTRISARATPPKSP